MSRRTVIIGIVSLVVLSLLVFVLSPGFKRTIPGRIIRFAAGKPGAVQAAEDLAEDALRKPELAHLQDWSIQVLARYRAGQLATNGAASYWSMGTVKLAAQEIPAGVTNAWQEPPEVSVHLSEAGQPDCVVLAWYLSGLAVGPPEYALSFKPWCSKQAKPGVYGYYLYK
jgi:hypothetical protein